MPKHEFRPLLLSNAPYAILEHAHFVPYSAGLSERFRPQKTERAPDEKLFVRLRRLWQDQEVWLSHALECVLLGYGPSLLGEIFGGASGGQGSCGLFHADWADLKGDVGVPDLIVIRGDTLYLVEIKSGSSRSKHRYSRQQYVKYMKFAALATCSKSLAAEGEVTLRISGAEHWLIAPYDRIEDCVGDFSEWQPAIDSHGQLTIGTGAAQKTFEDDVCRFLRDKATKCDLVPERYQGLAQTPAKLKPWPEFAASLKGVATTGGRPDLAREADRLEALASGKAVVRTIA